VPASSAFDDCVQRLLQAFKTYDRTVDVVCCWEFLFTRASPFNSSGLFFDRFPRMTCASAGETAKTPDFAVLFSEAYGIVGEIKEGFPRDEKSFISHFERLKKYDQPLEFRAGPGRGLIPAVHDIVLIVPLRDAQEIVTRLEARLADKALSFERQPVVFEWTYDSDASEYIFRRVALQMGDFRDVAVPEAIRLSKCFSERGASLKITPDKIKDLKANWQFCNDTPPVIYTLVFLWTKILYQLLNDRQREEWRRRDPRKAIWIEFHLDRLREVIEQLYPFKWGHWTEWNRLALDALAQGRLARKIGQDRYAVGYRNLTRELGEPRQAGRAGISDYARTLATHVCSQRGEAASEPADTGEPRQRRLPFDQDEGHAGPR
jgi:hypothetical protein